MYVEVGFPRRLPSVSNIPPRNAFFTGRIEILAQIHEKIKDRQGVAVGIVPLLGIGGVGKTQLAIEYAHRHAQKYSVLWWVDAATSDLTVTGLISLAMALNVPIKGPPAAIIDQLWMVLRSRDDWLLIFDNVDDLKVLSDMRPPTTGDLLVTSRRPAIGRLADLVEVSEFDRSESRALLRRRCPSLAPADAEMVGAALGDLPLAVEQAACFLSETGLTAQDYLRLLRTQPEAAGLSEPTLERHPGLSAVVVAGRSRVESLSPEAADLVDRMAFLAPEPLYLAPSDADPFMKERGVQVGDSTTTGEVVRSLTSLGLARRTKTALQLHRLVQALLRSRMVDDQGRRSYRGAQELIATAEPGDPKDPAHWDAYAALAPHIQALCGSRDWDTHAFLSGAGMHEEDPAEFRALFLKLTLYLYASGRFTTGAELISQVNDRWLIALGPHHIDTLRLANNLVANLNGLGEYSTACDLAQRTFVQCRAAYGEDHAVTLEAANELAGALNISGEHERARDLHRDTLSRKRSAFGEDHSSTLLSAGNLVAALNKLGEYRAARELAEDTLARCRATLGENSYDALYTAGRLVDSLNGIGEYSEAHRLAEDTLTRCCIILGKDHPRTLYTAARLAVSLDGLGEGSAAREKLVDVLGQSRRILGEGHPETQWIKEQLSRI